LLQLLPPILIVLLPFLSIGVLQSNGVTLDLVNLLTARELLHRLLLNVLLLSPLIIVINLFDLVFELFDLKFIVFLLQQEVFDVTLIPELVLIDLVVLIGYLEIQLRRIQTQIEGSSLHWGLRNHNVLSLPFLVRPSDCWQSCN